jgi:CRISPR-associated protein Cas2
MYLIVCYDIVDDRRRQRLCKQLKGTLDHVQKSVFEGPLPAQRYAQLLRGVLECTDVHVDTVRIYRMCNGCRAATDLIGTAHAVATEPEDIVV